MAASATRGPVGRPAEAIDLPSDPLEFSLECHRRGWSDGLPVIPPTRDRVDRMLAAAGRDPLEVIGVLAPRRGVATVELVAVNAVLAGCEPRQFEAVLAAVAATAEPLFNIEAVNATTHPVSMFVLLSGAAARAAGVHTGAGCFGPGFPANLAIGRALRLVHLSIAGAWPGVGDRSQQATPAKIAYCAAEREDACPWGPWHATRGVSTDAHAVTVFPCEGPHNIQDHGSNTADGIMRTIVGAMGQAGSNNLLGRGWPILALGVEHAQTLAEGGMTRTAIQERIFTDARYPAEKLSPEFLAITRRRDRPLEELLPIANGPETISVLVLGGAGKHSAWMPSFGDTSRPTTVSWTPHRRS